MFLAATISLDMSPMRCTVLLALEVCPPGGRSGLLFPPTPPPPVFAYTFVEYWVIAHVRMPEIHDLSSHASI